MNAKNVRPSRHIVRGVLPLCILVVATCLAMLTGVSGAGAAGAQPAPQPPKPRLLVIGDSVLEGTFGHIPAALPEWDVTVDAHMNRSTADGPAVLQSHGVDFDVVVVQLGTNDAGTPSIYEPRVNAMMDALAPVPRVLWLTIHEARPYYAQANEIIRRLAATHRNVQVVDWNAAQKPGDTYDDGLHLTSQGASSISALIAAAVRGPATPASTTTTTTVPPTTDAPPGTSGDAAGTHRGVTGGSSSSDSAASSGGSAADSGGSGALWLGLAAVAVAVGAAIPVLVARRRRASGKP